jgi:hypothetical protein
MLRRRIMARIGMYRTGTGTQCFRSGSAFDGRLDPDPHSLKKLDPDHKVNGDP